MECVDSVVDLEKIKSIDDLRSLKIVRLKEILREHKQPVSGKKEDLVLRCHVVVERKRSTPIEAEDSVEILKENQRPTNDFTYEVIIKEASDCQWKKDLRELPLFTFVQLYDYLVQRTSKYGTLDISTCGYKKLKAFQFFKEGHIKDLQLCYKQDTIYVKAEVLASMKSDKYKVVIVFDCFFDGYTSSLSLDILCIKFSHRTAE